MVRETLARILACPHCQAAVHIEAEQVTCTACGRVYPVRHGIPWMRPQDADWQAGPQQPTTAQDQPGWRRLAQRWPLASPICKAHAGRGRIPAFVERVRQTDAEALILNVGSGSTTYEGVINLDVAPFSYVELVADAMALPLLDGMLDGVITQGVLEHVRQPQQVVAEIWRVLKPGGLSYHELPFMQGDHTAADCPDFWRFTLSGAEALFEGFQTLERGVVVGPSSALAWLLREYLAILFSFNNLYLYKAAVRLMALVTLPLKYLDYLLAGNHFVAVIASAFYLIARKPEAGKAFQRAHRSEEVRGKRSSEPCEGSKNLRRAFEGQPTEVSGTRKPLSGGLGGRKGRK